jgi:sugar phosphate isomerase/epimerase
MHAPDPPFAGVGRITTTKQTVCERGINLQIQPESVFLGLMQPFSRRNFLKSSSVLALGATALRPLSLFGAAAKKKIGLGVQLYSVRKECAKDLPGTLNAIGKIGYQAVEFAGYHGRDAKTLRKLLDEAGLKCCGTHTGIETLLGEKLQPTIEFNKTLGNKFLIVPSLSAKYTKTREDWQKTADLFNEISEKARLQGMVAGYHNHDMEFKPLGDELPWDIFFNRAKRDVVIQFDMGNAGHLGVDPRVYLKKFPGRVASVHVKPYSKKNPNALIGEDELVWPEIFELCETTAGVEWYIIEYERENEPPLVSIEKLHKIMCGLGKC